MTVYTISLIKGKIQNNRKLYASRGYESWGLEAFLILGIDYEDSFVFSIVGDLVS